jgi:short-subunit dehydrogenase
MVYKALVAAGITAWAVRKLTQDNKPPAFDGEIALITGGSRGLGFLLARELAWSGCKVHICARDENELDRARLELKKQGAEVTTWKTDITDPEQVRQLVEKIVAYSGSISILVNNAGVIQVGPLVSMSVHDFENAQKSIFWGTVYPTLTVLPQMQTRRSGRIVNISSFGGKISVPHLLPYCSAKFAVTGFSEGLRAELSSDGIKVTTVYPGTMRTGSHLNAFFKGVKEVEYAWFSLGATIPFLSLDAERAAKQIVKAVYNGQAECIIPQYVNLLVRLHGLAPEPFIKAQKMFNSLLPDIDWSDKAQQRGMEVQTHQNSRLLKFATRLGQIAARRFNQYPGPKLEGAKTTRNNSN